MDKLGIKTTLYDVLGYVIPGMLLILGMYIMYMKNDSNDYFSIVRQLADVKSSIAFGTGVILCSYVLGHAISSIGYLLFENRLVKRIFNYKIPRWFYKIDERNEGEPHKARFKELLGDNADFSFRSVVAYSEENTKVAYDTAFVFLSIYGLSRNVAVVMILLLAAHYLIFKDMWNSAFYFAYFLCLLALLHNYFRFRQYYIAQIYASLSSICSK